MDNKLKKCLQLKIWRQTQVLVKASLALPTFLAVPIMAIEVSWTSTINMYIVQCAMYIVHDYKNFPENMKVHSSAYVGKFLVFYFKNQTSF